MTTQGRIVVGVDGSQASVEALRLARRQAALTGATVEAVTSWQTPVTFGGYPLLAGRDWEAVARRSLVATIDAAFPDGAPEVSRKVVQGRHARVLRNEAADADLLVLKGRTGPVQRLLGAAAATDGPCPVLIAGRHRAGPHQALAA